SSGVRNQQGHRFKPDRRLHSRHFAQIRVPTILAPGHEEPAAVVPANDRKSVESVRVSAPVAMGSGSGGWDRTPGPPGTMQGAIRGWPAPAMAVVGVVALKRSVPARAWSPLYRPVILEPATARASVPEAPPATSWFTPLMLATVSICVMHEYWPASTCVTGGGPTSMDGSASPR